MSSESRSLSASSLVSVLVPQAIRDLSAYEVSHPPGITIKLDANESPYPLPEEIQSALGVALGKTALHRYPDPGARELRELLAKENEVAPEQIVFGNGSDEIISLLMTAFSKKREGQKQSCVLFPSPSFSVFRLLTITHGHRPIEVPLTADFELNVEAMRDALAEHRPVLAFFARPNNPTGTLWPRDTILELCKEFSDVLFVSDEAYGEYATGSMVDLVGRPANLLVMKTLSKIGLAALRIGYLVASKELATEVNKARAPYNISALGQTAALFLLREHRQLLRDRCAEVVHERSAMAKALNSLPAVQRVFASEANLLLFRLRSADKAEHIWKDLCDRGILIRRFHGSPLQDCLRVTIGTPAENRAFLSAMKASS